MSLFSGKSISQFASSMMEKQDVFKSVKSQGFADAAKQESIDRQSAQGSNAVEHGLNSVDKAFAQMFAENQQNMQGLVSDGKSSPSTDFEFGM